MMSLLEASIKRHSRLNPKLWRGDILKPDVRESLLRFGRAWQGYAKIPEEAVHDVLFVGGNASYYYGEDSDIDVHLLIDKASLGHGEIIDEFLDDRKSLWTMKHNVTVRGYPLEPYAQDLSESVPQGQGVYSLIHETWIDRPVLTKYDPDHDAQLARKVVHWKRTIDKAIEDGGAEHLSMLKEKLKDMRTRAIKSGGELSQNNLVFKELRNSGYLDRLKEKKRAEVDKELSLK
jgi:hypothetical protein